MKYFLLLFFITVCFAGNACEMEPSFWVTVEEIQTESAPGIYSISDALNKITRRFMRGLRATNDDFLPIAFIAAFDENPPVKVLPEVFELIEVSARLAWRDKYISRGLDKLVKAYDDYENIVASAQDLCGYYSATIHVSNTGSSVINQVDVNFYLYTMVRTVYREEARVFLRITDSEGLPVLVDELDVSPTIIFDSIITPVGGFIIKMEQNSHTPLHIDFGTVTEGGEHVLRINDAYRQPSIVPPLDEFRWDGGVSR